MTLAKGNITHPIIEPVSGLTYSCVEYKIFFGWDGIIDAEHYDLQIATDSAFATKVIDWNVTSTSKVIKLNNDVYYVTVRGVESDATTGEWSNTLTVTVYSPDDASLVNDNTNYTKKIALKRINGE